MRCEGSHAQEVVGTRKVIGPYRIVVALECCEQPIVDRRAAQPSNHRGVALASSEIKSVHQQGKVPIRSRTKDGAPHCKEPVDAVASLG